MGVAQFPPGSVHLYRAVALGILLLIDSSACSTVPSVKHNRYPFPDAVFVELPERAFEPMKLLKQKVNFSALDHSDPDLSEEKICRNYYNRGAELLLGRARAQGADAVIDLRTVVALANGEHEIHKGPECFNDGQEGQILLQGRAVKWKKLDAK